MSVIVTELDEQTRSALQTLCLGFLHGECYAFAIAVHRGTGLPMVGLIKDNEIYHAGIKLGNGSLHDARGPVSEEEFGKPFSVSPLYELKEVEERDLYNTRLITDGSIERATEFAEILWPELPWLNTYASRVMAFATALEALGREHGFWIRGAVEAALPILSEMREGVAGYTLSMSDTMSFRITRRLAPN